MDMSLEDNMKTIPAGQFKTHCLSLLREVAKTHEPLVITKYGKPLARVVPFVNPMESGENPLKNSIVFEGDLLSPIDVEWEARP